MSVRRQDRHAWNGSGAVEQRRRLARELREQGLTQAQIAERLGVSKTSVQNYLRSENRTSQNRVEKRNGRERRLTASGSGVNEAGHREALAGGETVRGQSFEFQAAALVELGRHVDQARADLEPVQGRYEEACRRWQDAVARLPAADGFAPDAFTD